MKGMQILGVALVVIGVIDVLVRKGAMDLSFC